MRRGTMEWGGGDRTTTSTKRVGRAKIREWWRGASVRYNDEGLLELECNCPAFIQVAYCVECHPDHLPE